MPRPISLTRGRSPGLRRGPGRRRRARPRHGRASGGRATDVRVRCSRAPPIFDAGRPGSPARVARRYTSARARSAPPMAPPSGRPSSPCRDPHPPGAGRLRGAGTASAPGLARTFWTRPGIADGIISPARSSPGLSARHGRVSSVEAALVRLASFGARSGLRERCAGRDRRRGRPGVAGTPASPGLGRRGACSGPCGASGLIRSPTLCASCRVAGASHARGTARAAGGISRCERAG